MGGETGSIVFPEGDGRIKSGALCRSFRCPVHNTLLLDKVLDCVGPVAVASFLPLLHHRLFKYICLVFARDKLCDFVVFGDFDLVLFGVVFLSCDVAGVGAEMSVGGVAPVGDEGVLC